MTVSTLSNTSNEHPTMHPRKAQRMSEAGRTCRRGRVRETRSTTWLAASRHATQPRFQCTNFDQSIDFMNRVASIANDINHHPDIAVLDKRSVRVTAWTRKLGYLTDIDFDLAASVEAMYATEFADRPAR